MQKLAGVNENNGNNDGGLTGEEFTEILVAHMQKYLPKDRWTITYDAYDIIVENDFNEVATYRLHDYGKSYWK